MILSITSANNALTRQVFRSGSSECPGTDMVWPSSIAMIRQKRTITNKTVFRIFKIKTHFKGEKPRGPISLIYNIGPHLNNIGHSINTSKERNHLNTNRVSPCSGISISDPPVYIGSNDVAFWIGENLLHNNFVQTFLLPEASPLVIR